MLCYRYRNNGKPLEKLNTLQKNILKQINIKVEENKYRFENILCALCGENDFYKLSEKDRYGLYYPVVICKNCGLVQTNPRMDEKSYQEFYDIEYRKLYGGIEKPDEAFILEQQKRGENIYNHVGGNTNFLSRKDPLVLEVGCGAGGILKYFKDKGCDIKGIDWGQEYVEYGRTFNLDCEVATLENLKIHKNPDLIIYSHVLEHILDLDKELSLLNRLSDRNTLLYIEVPGIKNIHNAYQLDFLSYLQNAHTYHFTLTTLSGIFNKYGFDLISGDEYIQAIFKKREYSCEHEILNDFPSVLKYLKKIEKCRIIAQITLFIKKLKIN